MLKNLGDKRFLARLSHVPAPPSLTVIWQSLGCSDLQLLLWGSSGISCVILICFDFLLLLVPPSPVPLVRNELLIHMQHFRAEQSPGLHCRWE